jgi:CubicO group peptidase (beta-lactamase class C family)
MNILKYIQLLVLVVAPAGLMGMDQSSSDRQLTTKLDEYLDACVKHYAFRGTVLVAKGNTILVDKAYGMANFENKIPCTTQTRFNLASVSKQFTAMAIMLLVQKGLISVDDSMAKYMPKDLLLGDSRAKAITIHHCLTHTSGIKDFESLSEWKEDVKYNNAGEIIKLFKDKPLDFEPGTQYKYSNSGYVVLGYIVEKVSKQPLAQFMKENIFQPLNMNDTGFDYNAIDKRFAFGYTTDNKRVNYYDMSFAYGDGNLISTTQDLYLWSQALSSGKLLRSDLSKMLFTPHVKTGKKEAYGYGWEIMEEFGHKLICHNGGISGFSTNIFRFVDDDVCIVVLSNIDPSISPAYQMNVDLAAILFKQPYSPPKTKTVVAVDPVIFDAYVGNYKLSELDNMVIAITKESNKLYGQATGQDKFELFPESETAFFLKCVFKTCISFVKDKNGKVTKFILHQDGKDFVAEKI